MVNGGGVTLTENTVDSNSSNNDDYEQEIRAAMDSVARK